MSKTISDMEVNTAYIVETKLLKKNLNISKSLFLEKIHLIVFIVNLFLPCENCLVVVDEVTLLISPEVKISSHFSQ